MLFLFGGVRGDYWSCDLDVLHCVEIAELGRSSSLASGQRRVVFTVEVSGHFSNVISFLLDKN